MAAPTRRSKVDIPRVGSVPDHDTRDALSTIWKRLQQTIDTQDTLRREHDALSDSFNDLLVSHSALSQLVQDNQSEVRRGATLDLPGGGNPPGDDGGVGAEGGQGELGCSESGSTGHVTAGSPLNPHTAGLIVCGTGKEFPTLLMPTTDAAARVAQRYELLGRMLWHLSQAGFTAQRYTISPNPFVLIIDNLVEGLPAAYRVIDYAEFDRPIATMMLFVERSARFSPVVADGGTPD